MNSRGPYAKGVAKRQEILDRALAVIGSSGFAGASIRELADAVGLSQAGLLHYFDSKEDLFTEILRTRDAHDERVFGVHEAGGIRELRQSLGAAVRHNSQVPGIVELFSRLAVDAADPSHAAAEYFGDRGARLRSAITDVVRTAQDSGEVTRAVPAETVARMLQALSDGVQLQWLQDSSVEMATVIDALFLLLSPSDSEESSAGI